MKLAKKITTLCLLWSATTAIAQTNIPIGEWRLHLSFDSVRALAFSLGKTYAASSNEILVVDQLFNGIRSYNTLNRLTSTGISALGYDLTKQKLVVAYNDGGIDILSDEEDFFFSRLRNTEEIIGSKRINDIAIRQSKAYLAADFGMIVFDLEQNELVEIWRGLGPTGNSIGIRDAAFKGDSIFLATPQGVIAGNLNSNLLDFNKWKRYNAGLMNNAIMGIVSNGMMVFAAINNVGLVRWSEGRWTLMPVLQGQIFRSIEMGSTGLIVTTSTGVFEVSADNVLKPVTTEKISGALTARYDLRGGIWIGDRENGVITNAGESFTALRPNGPSISNIVKLRYLDQGGGAMVALAGGFTSSGLPRENKGVINRFQNGQWTTETFLQNDLTDVEWIINSRLYTSSFGDGLELQEGNATVRFNNTNSSLQDVNGNGTGYFISDMENAFQGLWIANYGAPQPLSLLSNGSWQSFAVGLSAARFPTRIAVDQLDQVWMAIDPSKGGGLAVYNRRQNATNFFTEAPGSGNLPDEVVYSLAVDRDGYIWIGTASGVAYFFSATSDAIKPIFENRFLLRDEKITDIEIDGGNRKWIGTERGLWLFSPSGEELIHHFTTENSPLLSNSIRDVEIHDASGEVFIATDKGLISYRGDATAGTTPLEKIKIFPNPVTSEFSGLVGIAGVAEDAIVKITDISGKLVWQTQANGGTATWNVRDSDGRRAAMGIYLVFAATETGGDRLVGKIAVVD